MRNKKQKTDTKKRNKTSAETKEKKKSNGVGPSPTNTMKDPIEMIKDPVEIMQDPEEMMKDPEETMKDPEKTMKDPVETIKHPTETLMHPTETMTQSTEPIKHLIETTNTDLPKLDSTQSAEPMEHPIETMNHTNETTMHPTETINYPVEMAIESIKMMKHPLEHTWTFWMFTNNKQKWEDNLQKLATFDTVEDYWCLYHFMKLPSELQIGQDYAIFKKGIRPMWEDPGNRKGGRWLITLDKRKEPFMDRLWLDAVLIMIGENFKYNENVCGICINVRPKSKIALWTADASNNEENLEIGEKLKRTLAFKMIYQVHDSSDSCHTL